MRLPILMLLLSASPVLASSDEAWDQFRADVQTACTALAPAEGETAIEVNPFGSESYGAALLITTLPDGGADRYVCIYDKQTKKAEISGAFIDPEDQVSMGGNAPANRPVSSTDASLPPAKPDQSAAPTTSEAPEPKP
ncbi:hypothetical protein [Paracoccus shanxieyensis]|uniref:hypothetical protein n=1 Tax=Paracoccus shanxieyensis TaxID=2675752 RepID=UPI001E298A4D|nr:hypothetical protein [Paracoccus shanxieyensis]